MINLLKTPGRLAGTLLAAALVTAAHGAVARPGTVNYAEGQVSVNGQAVDAKQMGSTQMSFGEVAAGQFLETGNGKAEMLLFPGAFLRLGENSQLRMVSPSLTDTRVELLRGQALVEVDQIQKEHHLRVLDNGVTAQLEKNGIYRFDATQPMLSVYDGKAEVVQGDDRAVEVGKGKQLPLDADARLQPQKFDRKETDSLFEWSKLRSDYLAQANRSSAESMAVNGGGWYGGGWYWNPWYSTWGFFPGAGYAISPFGYGFYSPSYWSYRTPLRFQQPRGRVWTGGPVTGRTGRFGARGGRR